MDQKIKGPRQFVYAFHCKGSYSKLVSVAMSTPE